MVCTCPLPVRVFAMRRSAMLASVAQTRLSRLPTAGARRLATQSTAGEKATQAEVDETAKQMSYILRVLAVSWLSYKLYEVYLGSNTYLVAPSVQLVRSKKYDYRETGISRISSWHSSETALPAVVASGGVEALLDALPSAAPQTRGTVVDLLVRMAAVEGGRDRLLAANAATRAAAACEALAGGGAPPETAARCHSLTAALAEALLQQDSPPVGPEGGAGQ